MTTAVPISKRLVAINSFSSLAAAAINASILVWLQQFLLKRISPEEYSIYPVVASVSVIGPILTIILTDGLSRYAIEAYARNDRKRVTEVVSSMFPLLAGTSLLLLAGGALLAWYADVAFEIPDGRLSDARVMIFLMVLGMSLRLLLAVFGIGLPMNQKYVLANLLELGAVVLRVAILLILLFCVSVRVKWVVVALVSTSVLRILVHTAISMRLVPELRFRLTAFRIATARQVAGFGLWRLLARMAETIRVASDAIILNRFAAPIDVNCFYLGALVVNQVQTFSVVAGGPLQPALTAMHAADDQTRLRNAFIRGGKYALWASMMLATPVIVFRVELIQLYIAAQEPEYLPAATVMGLLLSVFPFSYGMVMFMRIAHATARVRPEAICAFVIQAINLMLTIYLVRWCNMGAFGSALSTFVVSAVGFPLIYLPMALRVTGVALRDWLNGTLLPGLAPAVIGALFWAALQWWFAPSTWTGVFECIAAGYLAYFAVLIGGCMAPHEKQDLKQVWRRVTSRGAPRTVDG